MTAQPELGTVELLATTPTLLPGQSADTAADPIALLSFSLASKDGETKGHCERLASRAVALGRALRLAEAEIEALRLGGILHDIGKLFIPDAIIHKACALTASERVIMNEHPVLGERLCAPIAALRPALPVIRHHHERFDGSGYPDRLCGEQIPLVARIVQIVDIFDALTTARPYKPAWDLQKSLRTMRGEGERGWIDGRLLREFTLLINCCG